MSRRRLQGYAASRRAWLRWLALCGMGVGGKPGAAPAPAAAAASGPDGPAARVLQVGVLYWSATIPGQVAMRRGLEDEAERINAQAQAQGLPQVRLQTEVAGDGPAGVERQIAQMQAMVAARPDAIIVQPTDNAALAAPLRAANAARIPVVAYDQYISGGELAAYVTSDNHQAGYLDGEYMAAQFPPGQLLRLVLVEYPLVSSTVERLDGFLDALRERGRRFRILKSYRAVEPVEGRAAGAAILRDFPAKGSVDLVFTVNDGGGLAVVQALHAAGRDEIAVASVDGDPASVENIRAGRLTRIVAAQFCGPLGATAMASAYALLRGGKVARHILVPTFPVTRETLHRYPGWAGPIPAAFDKPWPARERRWQGVVREAR